MLRKTILIFISIIIFLMNSLVTIESFADWHIASEIRLNRVEDSNAGIIISSSDNTVLLDTTNASEGFVRVRYSGENPTVRVRITKDNEESYPYWITKDDEFETFILAFGSGEYEIAIYEKSHEDFYTQIFSEKIQVNINNPIAPFLHPNFFVEYTEQSTIAKIAAALYLDSKGTGAFVQDVYNYVINYSYDYEKSALIVTENLLYKPDFDEIQLSEKGICFDYAAVMVGMLRSQGIPAKLEFGYVDGNYHSWANVFISENSTLDGGWQLYDPTTASNAGMLTVKKFMEDSNNYIPLYVN